MIDYKGIGIRIRDMRKMKKMTQEQLAEAAGVGVTHISHIETGNSVPSLQVMVDSWPFHRGRMETAPAHELSPAPAERPPFPDR